MRDVNERFFDMLEAIKRIEKYAERGRLAFVSDELIQNYVVHNLRMLGEAAAKVPVDLQLQYPELPWSKMIGMRNVLVHGYFSIDLDEAITRILDANNSCDRCNS